MKIQNVDEASWVLLLSGKARTVCTDLGSTADYEGVNPERCRKKFRAHTWTRNQEPTEWIAEGKKMMATTR